MPWNCEFRKLRDCAIYVAKTKDADLVFTYAKSRFSHDAAHFIKANFCDYSMISTTLAVSLISALISAFN